MPIYTGREIFGYLKPRSKHLVVIHMFAHLGNTHSWCGRVRRDDHRLQLINVRQVCKAYGRFCERCAWNLGLPSHLSFTDPDKVEETIAWCLEAEERRRQRRLERMRRVCRPYRTELPTVGNFGVT